MKAVFQSCSNRTFMELKFRHVVERVVTKVGSNRTFMELKRGETQIRKRVKEVLIVPLWN